MAVAEPPMKIGPWLIPASILSAAQANLQNPRPPGHASPATAGVRWEAFAAVTGK